MQPEIKSYYESFTEEEIEICNILHNLINAQFGKESGKIWHAHPVWFVEGNPIVGFSKLKNGIRLLFWSGQSFDDSKLKPEGKFKAAEIRYTSKNQIQETDVIKWLELSISIQWDYKNLVKRKGALMRLK